jgi:hypothetical protein
MRRKTDDLQADYWKAQAEQARARADLTRDLIAKTTMLEIARKYEAMAELGSKPNKACSSTSVSGATPDFGHVEQFVRD